MTDVETVAGPWFEDFQLGQEFDAPAITVNEGHVAIYHSLFGDRMRLPLDRHSSEAITGSGWLVHPLLAINIAIGQSTWASQRVKANLFYRGLVLRRPVYVGDTLSTRTRIVGMRQNQTRAGRGATGIVALEIETRNQHGEVVLRFWRCPMIPCRLDTTHTGHADDLDTIGAPVARDDLLAAVPRGWQMERTLPWSGVRASALEPGQAFRIESRDTVTSAPELVRLTLNMAMAHTDARLSYLGERLVYGGHTISLAFAQIGRALPNLLTILAWESCDHLAPVVENDRLRTTFTVAEVQPLGLDAGGGALLRIDAECFASRGDPEQESRVLDWRFWAWSA
jgi:acyl dehydratase